MGILGKIFQRSNKKKPAITVPEQQKKSGGDIAPELEKALQAMLANYYPEAIAQASKSVHSETPDIKADAHRICAISYSRLGDYEKAFEHYLFLFEVEGGAHTALQLATTSVMCCEVQRGEAWFIKFSELNSEEPKMSSGEARTNYITALTNKGYWEKAFNHLNWLKEGYQLLHITDSNFLYMRGFPFLSVMLEKSYTIVSQVLKREALILWYAELGQGLDNDGQEAVNIFINSIKEGADPEKHPEG
ncbi:hypothetical protein [Klebsiella aerogenes]|uniref:Tetratricopeptide repeat protein n=1 Tax=Klebsiella aerogenes TaxID=548 RepID=A0AAP9R2S2_KLEAE|nr:hypothetical protein [Klebsiella aerogenes]QMR43030.1 hypothetical protein HV331_26460 [Klebsiella aerogenes]